MTSPAACGFSLWALGWPRTHTHTHTGLNNGACEDCISFPKGRDTFDLIMILTSELIQSFRLADEEIVQRGVFKTATE